MSTNSKHLMDCDAGRPERAARVSECFPKRRTRLLASHLDSSAAFLEPAFLGLSLRPVPVYRAHSMDLPGFKLASDELGHMPPGQFVLFVRSHSCWGLGSTGHA